MAPLHCYIYVCCLFTLQNNGSSACISTERTALLAFKSKLKDPRNLLSTWKGQNCCSWEGVTCHNNSGHVVKLNLRYPYIDLYPEPDLSLNGKIDPSLLSLRNLTHLDLSGNNFNETEIPKFIGQFENLVYLNLSSTKFVGKIPAEIGNLKKLLFLDMSNTYYLTSVPPELGNISTLSFLSFNSDWKTLKIENIHWISKLSSLQHLDLSYVNLSSFTDWFYVFNKLKYLNSLILNECQLYIIPSSVAALNLTRLTTLDLSANWFESLVPSWLGNLTSVSHLDLSSAGFYGLSNGFLANSKEQICQLRYLDLSWANITEDVTNLVRMFSCSSKNIKVLSLAYNNIYGNLLTNWLNELPFLEHLDLSQNFIAGVLPLQMVKLSKLNYLDLTSNNLKVVVTQNSMENLAQLQVLDLSLNHVKWEIGQYWLPKFQLTMLGLQSCNVGPLFPSWLRSQKQLIILNLQNASINDALPPWFWRLSYQSVDLSHNNLYGMLPHKLQSPNLLALILASNNLGGPIESLPHDLEILDISNNKFSGTLSGVSNQSNLVSLSIKNNSFVGEIPFFICEMVYLSILDLSINNLSGKIPKCVSRLRNLEILDMSFNNLSGSIPNSIGSMRELMSLVLHSNALTGELPSNLQYCQSLEFLDLGYNKLTGKLPTWIGASLKELSYLQLRENNFSGNIPFELALLPNLQVLDVARNNLEGPIPDSIRNFSAMASNSKQDSSITISIGSYYKDGQGYYTIGSGYIYFPMDGNTIWYSYSSTLAIITKGEILEYSTTLFLVKSIDLSDNYLSGFIPNSITTLKSLENLNLSRNNLNGKVPEDIGNMKLLESLDLSFNKLSGEIPQSISGLTFLSHLNLSYNNFSGPIPVGNQLNSLNDSSIYIGNVFLCGGPLNRSCIDRNAKNIISGGKSSNLHTLWLYLSASAGFLVGWWGVWCILLLHGTWSTYFFEKVDYLYYKLFK